MTAQRFLTYLGIGLLVMAPGVVIRLTGLDLGAPAGIGIFGVAMLAAGFLLTAGSESAERHVTQGLAIAILALITVLPEYSVDIYLAFQAGRDPSGGYAALAAANMTGANRMLIGLAWPLVVLLSWNRTGERGVRLRDSNVVEIAFLALATLYSGVIVLKRSISVLDLVVLFAIFGAYIWRVSRAPEEKGDEAEETGVTVFISRLAHRWQHVVIVAFAVVAAAVILAVAEPFAESIIATGQVLGIDKFLLIQWLAPLASEAPAVIVAALLAWRARSSPALGALVSDKINQWTLLVGMLPLFLSFGAGQVAALELDARQREEFLLTAAQSLFAVALLLPRRLGIGSALALLVLFLGQLGLAFVFRADEARSIQVLTWAAYVYLGLSALVVLRYRVHLAGIVRDGLLGGAGRAGTPVEPEGGGAPVARKPGPV